jgi:phospholipid-binding lipoprotein MlaA
MAKALMLAVAVLLGGCASLEGPEYGAYDPYEKFNRGSYKFSDAVDKNVLVPVVRGYQAITPQWLRNGIGNVFSNLRELDSALNGYLQLKPGSGTTDLARVALNTTVGIGGFFDVATSGGLIYQEEDLGQTLAVAGITRTRYVYVPLAGPTTVRDAPYSFIRAWWPRLLLGSAYGWWMGIIDLLNTRAEVLAVTEARDASALDPYAFTREAYYQRRKFLIYDGDPPMDDFFDDYEDEDEAF